MHCINTLMLNIYLQYCFCCILVTVDNMASFYGFDCYFDNTVVYDSNPVSELPTIEQSLATWNAKVKECHVLSSMKEDSDLAMARYKASEKVLQETSVQYDDVLKGREP